MKKIKDFKIDKNGFTLVEIIVVLVILAVLAAFTIPAMLGFMEDAKAKAYIAEAREVYVAAQSTATEYIGTGKKLDFSSNNPADALNSYWVSRSSSTGSNPASVQMKKYLGNDLKVTQLDYRGNYAEGDSYWYVIMGTAADGEEAKVKKIYYVKNGYAILFEEGNPIVEKLKPPTQRPDTYWSITEKSSK